MPISDFPIFNYYDKQRFTQFSPQDCANWYLTQAPTGKKKNALYPTMGRKHITFLEENVLVFSVQPRAIFRSINFMYVVVGSTVIMVDNNFTEFPLVNDDFNKSAGPLYFAFLPVTDVEVYVMICDGTNVFIVKESDKSFETINLPSALNNPTYVAAFGNRFVVAGSNSTTFYLTKINVGTPAVDCFDNGSPTPTVFAQETGQIRQLAVLHNQLYIFTDFTTGIWSNTPSQVFNESGNVAFPWKKNTSYDWDYGIADPQSLDTDFGMMVWLAQNRNGLVQFMASNGQMPTKISTQAVNTLLQQGVNQGQSLPFLTETAIGFLYQYEDSIFYRVSAGESLDPNGTSVVGESSTLEYNFDTQTWHRCIELSGGRNLIEDHVFFSGAHIVTVLGQKALYEMAGNIYYNEAINPLATNPQSSDYFIQNPFRYEMITPIIAQDDYSEFKTNYVEIDFVWGYGYVPISYGAFPKPHIELYWSDDGGVTFLPADHLLPCPLGVYQWRMRWYQLGVSRNRCYKLICVSDVPIVILGAVHDVVRISGGAN